MATDTDYRRYTWRNLGQKELKEMWFAARGTYSTSNQTVSLSALGNYFGTGDFKDSILKHEGPEYLVALRYHGNGTTSENPLPLTYKIDTNDERQNSNVAASITADNVVEISMATGLKVDAYRIKGESFLKNCWRNQEIADSIEQPFVDNAETVHEATVDLNLPSNMTYVKLPRYGFTNEAIEKVGVDGLFDSVKEKRTENEAIGSTSSSATDGTKIYEPGFKWGFSLMINGNAYDTSRLKDWGFAERVPIVLADTYTKRCNFHLPSITIHNNNLLVTANDNITHTYKLADGDMLVCYEQEVDTIESSLTPVPKFFEGHQVWETPLYTWYRKEFSPRNPTQCVTDLLMSPHLNIKMKQNYKMTCFNIAADGTDWVLQQADTATLQAANWNVLTEEPFKAPLNKTLNLNYIPKFEDCTFNKDKTEVITEDKVTYSVGAPMKATFDEKHRLTGITALSENIERYRTNPSYISSMPTPDLKDTFGQALEKALQAGQYKNYFEWSQKQCCGEPFTGWLDISTLPLELSINGLIAPFCYTTDDLAAPTFNGRIKEKNSDTATYTYQIRKETLLISNGSSTVQGETTTEKTFSFVNKPCFVTWGGYENRPNAYFWNFHYGVENTPWSFTHDLNVSKDFTNETFFDEIASRYITIETAICYSLREVKVGDEFLQNSTLLADNAHVQRDYIKITDKKWGSFFETTQDPTMYPNHVVFILWSKSPDAYEYLKKQLLKSP